MRPPKRAGRFDIGFGRENRSGDCGRSGFSVMPEALTRNTTISVGRDGSE
jgi:hypothetical protein